MKKVITLWILAALIVLASIVLLMETSLPIFTIIWLVVPLIIIIRNKKTVIGIGKISKNELIKYAELLEVLMQMV
jgi:hypothetical protein